MNLNLSQNEDINAFPRSFASTHNYTKGLLGMCIHSKGTEVVQDDDGARTYGLPLRS